MTTGISTVKFQLATERERALEEADGPAQLSPDALEMREGQPR